MGGKYSKAVYIGGALVISGAFYTLMDDSDTEGVSGISNLGNTCFLNAILQALSACSYFASFLTSLRPLKNNEDPESQITKELCEFLESLSSGRPLSPEDLVDALSQKFPYFGQQHDSHEIFYVISEALTLIKKRTDNSFVLNKNLENPLLGLMNTEITCSSCTTKTVNLETIFDISLIVSRSLYESFENFSRVQVLDDFLCLKCSTNASLRIVKSNSSSILKGIAKNYQEKRVLEESELLRKVKTRAFIKTQICKFPLLLCIHCKWLVGQGGVLRKRDRKMEFPLKFEVPKGRYELRAVVEHTGGGYGGHYFTYKLFQGDWYFCSDLEVRVVRVEQVLEAQAYMLFYELIANRS